MHDSSNPDCMQTGEFLMKMGMRLDSTVFALHATQKGCKMTNYISSVSHTSPRNLQAQITASKVALYRGKCCEPLTREAHHKK